MRVIATRDRIELTIPIEKISDLFILLSKMGDREKRKNDKIQGENNYLIRSGWTRYIHWRCVLLIGQFEVWTF